MNDLSSPANDTDLTGGAVSAEYDTVLVRGDGPVRHLVLNRPEVHNAVNNQLIADVHQACLDLDADPAVRVVVVRGEGKSFCSGADLKQPRGSSRQSVVDSKEGARMYDTLMHMTPLTVALCHGYMIGGGAVLPAACDFRIGGPSVSLTVNEVSIGFNLTWHSLPALVNLVGPHRAKEMLILGRTYEVEALERFGYFNEVAADDSELLAAGARLAAEIVNQPPMPVAASKASINAQAMPLARAINHLDHVAVAYMGKSDNSRKARHTYFDKSDRSWSDD